MRLGLLARQFAPHVRVSMAKARGGKTLSDFDPAPFVSLILRDDLASCHLPVKAMLVLYIGSMGARDKNFYNDDSKRLGYEEAAAEIHNLYLEGKKSEAVAAAPDQLVDEIALIGPRERIAQRAEAWKASPVNSMLLGAGRPEALRALAELVL